VATLFDVISALPLARERKFSSPEFMARKRRDYRRIARRADLVITISEETRRQFLALERPRARVLVIPPGLSPEFLAREGRPADGRALKRLGISDPYLLAVGAFWPRKNPEAALEVFLRARARMPSLKLVMAGEPGSGWNQRSSLGEWLARAGDGVRILGYLDRGDLVEVYSGAALFLYLSHYEGFGRPVLEARACGTPVVASGRGGIPEAAGEAALLVNPDDPGDVENAVFRVLHDKSCPARLRELGLQRAARFTWEAAARAVNAAYMEVLDSWKKSCGTRGVQMS
jgi:alpha-1,3-rhamnosyl/mannosyltransferase